MLSSWYRLFGSARLRSPDAQRWLAAWWPDTACGGKRGSGIMDALGCLAEAALGDEEGYLLSLDYSLAFDRLDPQLVRLLLLQAGIPAGTCSVMSAVWENQLRFLQYDNQCLPYGIRVSTSMPQGDAWSLVAMVLCLAGPSRQIQEQFPTCVQRIFVDDRTCVARTAREAMLIQEAGADWSTKLGMLENQDKIRHFHARAQGRSNLALAGAPQERICQDPCVLGVHLRGRQSRRNTPKEEARLASSCKLIRRCAMLPVSWQWRKRVVSTKGLAKAVWGWVLRLPPKADRKGSTPPSGSHFVRVRTPPMCPFVLCCAVMPWILILGFWPQTSPRHKSKLGSAMGPPVFGRDVVGPRFSRQAWVVWVGLCVGLGPGFTNVWVTLSLWEL